MNPMNIWNISAKKDKIHCCNASSDLIRQTNFIIGTESVWQTSIYVMLGKYTDNLTLLTHEKIINPPKK